MKHGSLRIGATTYHYVEEGRGRPLLLLHGNTGSSLWYERVMEMPGWRCVAPDLPNFGRSSALAAPISVEAYADALADFITAMKIEGAVLVGHSMGGSVALALAARRGKLLGGLVLVDSSAPSGLKTAESHYPALEAMRTNRPVLSLALGAVVPTLKDGAFFERLVDEAMLMAPPAWIGNADALGRLDCGDKLRDFDKPVLVVWGRKDVLVTEAMARETAAAFPRARLEIIEEVGHSLIVEDPAAFKTLLAEFLVST